MRILLVEDDAMIGEAICVALKDAAYAVDWVKDGVAAGLALDNGEHQAVLLDDVGHHALGGDRGPVDVFRRAAEYHDLPTRA